MAQPYWITPKGSLGTYQENTYQTILLSYNLEPAGELILLSGDLPEGFILNPVLSSIQGTLASTSSTKTYQFTLRVQNTDGVADRSFHITVTNSNPYWVTDSIIVQNNYFNTNYRQEQFFEMFFEIVDIGTQTIKYELISGAFPDNLVLEQNGRLSGFLPKNPKTYNFKIRATGSQILEKDFEFILLNFDGVRPPFWSTLSGWIGNIQQGDFFSFDLSAGDADNNTLSFTLADGQELPPGLILSSNGLIQGTHYSGVAKNYTFFVNVSDGIRTVTRRFIIRANYTLEDETLYLVQPPNTTIPALIGDLLVDEDSYFKIEAVSNSANWIRFEVTSGTLPNGLFLEQTTGEIRGTVLVGAEVQSEYVFTVTAKSNFFIEDSLDFKINIKPREEFRQKRISTIVTGNDRQKFNNFFYNYVIPYNTIYRPADQNFGITLTNELILKKYCNVNNNDIQNDLINRIGSQMKPERFISVPVLSSTNNIICDAVLCIFKDESLLSEDTFIQPNTNREIKTASVPIIRRILENNYAAPDDAYSKWDSFYYETDIKNDKFIVYDHDIYTGKKIIFSGQDIPSPFLNNVVYYAIKIDNNSFKLSNSYEGSLSGSFVKFNINDIDRGGVLRTYHMGIPIVFCVAGKGSFVATELNNEFDKKYFKLSSITLSQGGDLDEDDGIYIRNVIGGDAYENATVKIVIEDSEIISADIINSGRYKTVPSGNLRLSNTDINTENYIITPTWIQNDICFYDITLYLKYIVTGPTQTKFQEELEMLWFDVDYLRG